MTLAVMQPYLFPYLGYYQLFHAADRFIAYDDVNFIKQGWINRNRILINGAAAFFTVPVHDRSSFRAIVDVEIDGPEAPWRRKLLKTIETAYRRAPQFADVFPLVQGVLTRPVTRIADLALASLSTVLDYLEVTADIERSSATNAAGELAGQDRVIAMCRRAGATEYVNAGGAGRELYSAADFAASGLRLWFLQPHLREYRQFGGPFVPGLSIIDVLMFNPKATVRGYLEDYERG